MSPSVDRLIILADESANWKIAGLRQLDRLVLALDEFARSTVPESKIDIFIFWKPGLPERWQPRNSRITHCNFVTRFESLNSSERVLDARLFLKRHGFDELVRDSVLVGSPQSATDDLKHWQNLAK